MSLTIVETEYVKLLEPELRSAIENGEPNRAASFAKELARLKRKAKRAQTTQIETPANERSY